MSDTATDLLQLRLMSDIEFAEFMVSSFRDYKDDLVRELSLTPEQATVRAINDSAGVKKEGPSGPNHKVWSIEFSPAYTVGALWLGTKDKWCNAWIYDIRIDADQRGKGLGRKALELAERAATNFGSSHIGLHVFSHNTIARSLYSSAGYSPTHDLRSGLEMWKELA